MISKSDIFTCAFLCYNVCRREYTFMTEKEVKEKEEVVDEDFKDVKKANKKNPVLRIISIILWVLILAWLVVVIFDFYKVSQEEDPVFCISKETITYDDGTVDLCTGLGYKVYNYHRSSINGYEFGPFWIEERTEQ